MNASELNRLPTEELWRIYEALTETLAGRIVAEKRELDAKLELLHQQGATNTAPAKREKRKYPKVLQKYRNPQDPEQTWSGRGKKPLWVARLLKSGAKLDDFIMPQYRKLSRKAAA